MYLFSPADAAPQFLSKFTPFSYSVLCFQNVYQVFLRHNDWAYTTDYAFYIEHQVSPAIIIQDGG